MTVKQLDKSVIHASVNNPFTYYSIVVFTDPEKQGYELKTAYKTIEGARHAAVKEARKNNLSGIVSLLNIRKNEIIHRVPDKLEISSSGLVEEFIL